jgi:hypothetical protein
MLEKGRDRLMEKSKKERMNDILTKLEDVKNSQEALIVKIATIQIELLELPDNKLEEAIAEAHAITTNNTEKIGIAIEKYQMAINILE